MQFGFCFSVHEPTSTEKKLAICDTDNDASNGKNITHFSDHEPVYGKKLAICDTDNYGGNEDDKRN